MIGDVSLMNSVRKMASDVVTDTAAKAGADEVQTPELSDLPVGAPAETPPESTQPTPVASWYAQGMADGLGDRLMMFDNTAAASLELLRFRPELATAPGFERALRESLQRLAFFKHPSFGQARAVEYLDGDDGLALVSTHTPGKRLYEMFQSRHPRAGMHPAFVTWLIRQLAPAVADFHAHGRGIAHGALTAERIILTPDGRVVIVEHVIGAALDQLRLSPNQLWRDLGVIAVTGFDGEVRLNGHADVVQLGLVALSVLLGRRVTPEDYETRLDALLDEFAANAGKRSPTLVPPLRQWLERALQMHGKGFASALDAAQELGALPPASGTQAFEYLSQPRALGPSPEKPMNDSPADGSTPAAAQGDPPPALDGIEFPEPFDLPAEFTAARATERVIAPPPLATEREFDIAREFNAQADLGLRGKLRLLSGWREYIDLRTVAAACALLAAVEAAVIARLLTRPQPVQAPVVSTVPVTIDSPVPGDIVMVDGQQVGVTPFKLDVGASTHSIRVHSLERLQASAPPAASTTGASEAEERAATALAAAAARQRSGGLRLIAPFDVQVLEGEKVLGSSADGPVVTTAGTHQLDLVNNAVGYRARQTVEIKAGQIVSLNVKAPDGRISINAQPWAQVSIDGKSVGETPLANLSVPLGEHEIVFRHPQLGERRETVVVKAGAPARVSATMGR